jgi:hypothetical protein
MGQVAGQVAIATMTVDGPDGDRYSSEPVGDGRDEAGQAATGGNGKNSGPGRHGQDKVGQVVTVTMTVGGPGKNGKSSGPGDNSNDKVSQTRMARAVD